MIAGIRGAILAGGGATRFGGLPKGLKSIGGVRILDRVLGVMQDAFGGPPILVANDPAAGSWAPGLEVVPDLRLGLGTLGGILTAVHQAPAPVVCVAWDMPFLSAALIRELATGLGDHDAVLPRSGSRRGVEPLCAAYGPACAAAIEQALAEGDLRAIGFHRFVRVGILEGEQVRRFGDPDRLFFNVNTPEDLARAREIG